MILKEKLGVFFRKKDWTKFFRNLLLLAITTVITSAITSYVSTLFNKNKPVVQNLTPVVEGNSGNTFVGTNNGNLTQNATTTYSYSAPTLKYVLIAPSTLESEGVYRTRFYLALLYPPNTTATTSEFKVTPRPPLISCAQVSHTISEEEELNYLDQLNMNIYGPPIQTILECESSIKITNNSQELFAL